MDTLLVLLIVGTAGWMVWRYTRRSLSGKAAACDACSNCPAGPGNCPQFREDRVPPDGSKTHKRHVE